MEKHVDTHSFRYKHHFCDHPQYDLHQILYVEAKVSIVFHFMNLSFFWICVGLIFYSGHHEYFTCWVKWHIALEHVSIFSTYLTSVLATLPTLGGNKIGHNGADNTLWLIHPSPKEPYTLITMVFHGLEMRKFYHKESKPLVQYQVTRGS